MPASAAASAPQGICPRCLVAHMLAPPADTGIETLEPEHFGANPSFGDYELLSEIRARRHGRRLPGEHRRLNRIVALKMILSSPLR